MRLPEWKERFFMKITQIKLNRTNIEIRWNNGGAERITLLYRHSDYSWHLDADTERLTPYLKEELQRHVWAALAARTKQSGRKRPADTWFADRS